MRHGGERRVSGRASGSERVPFSKGSKKKRAVPWAGKRLELTLRGLRGLRGPPNALYMRLLARDRMEAYKGQKVASRRREESATAPRRGRPPTHAVADVPLRRGDHLLIEGTDTRARMAGPSRESLSPSEGRLHVTGS